MITGLLADLIWAETTEKMLLRYVTGGNRIFWGTLNRRKRPGKVIRNGRPLDDEGHNTLHRT
jgi:hypothetical protein